MSTSTSYVLTDGVNEQRFHDGKDLSRELNQRCKSTPRDYWCDLKVQITLGENEKLRVWRKAELPPMQAAEWHRQHKEYAGHAFFFGIGQTRMCLMIPRSCRRTWITCEMR